MSPFVLSQVLVAIAICTDLLSFQFKNRRQILCCLIISSILIAVHFMLLAHWTAAGLGVLAGLRFFVGYWTTSKKMMGLFLTCSLGVGVFTYGGPLSLLCTCGALCNTVGSFAGEDRRMRQWMFLGTGCWLSHNLLAGSPTAVLLETIFLASNLVGYYRYYLRPSLGTCPTSPVN
ncbi:YgjV family protein [Desulfogranum mediterraneum]|uniref:YgjV family protein n=1 Tax=Desulfogranum mediterraneum TaxID=160661 RepID=UPI0004186307|nr:YgjV family protein [Desulfogranum mediterraneum]